MPYNIDELLNKIENEINSLDITGEPVELYQPLQYGIQNGGKRIRPLLVLLACEMFEGEVEKAVPLAVGIELFHNFTLIHDDIMDQAPIRRGAPSVYKKWDVNTAILSGDVLFSVAYQYMLKAPDGCLKDILELFNETVIRICEGQQYDMNFEKTKNITESQYLNMIRLKTAVLPANSLKIGAILAGSSKQDLDNIYKFGEMFGMAFQLKDDWLDVFGDEDVFGKKNGGDIVANKKTWLHIKAIELADDKQLAVLNQAYSDLLMPPIDKINKVKEIYFKLGIGDLAKKLMEDYYKTAFDYIYQINVAEKSKSNIVELIKSLFERKF